MKTCNIDIQGEDKPFQQEETRLETALSSGYVDDLEHTVSIAGKLQRITLKTKAFTLIIWFTTALMLLYALDVFITNLGWKNSELLSGVFELFKYLVPTLVGFVFSSKLEEHK